MTNRYEMEIKMKKSFQITKSFNHAFFLLILIILIFPGSPAVIAESENEILIQRIEKLEKELNELKALIIKKTDQEETVEKPAAPAEKPSKGFSIKPYGSIKLDAAYNDSAVTNGNYVVYVPSEASARNDDEFNVTARETRLGLEVTTPEYDGWKTTGKVEIDFYGDSILSHENEAELMLRHAFIETTKNGVTLLVGQTWDVISPLNPSTLNYTAGWGAGNIGFRRPQVRMSYDRILENDTSLLTQVALLRTTGLANEDLDMGGQNDGDDSGFPTIQVRAALSTRIFTEKKAVIGISGHYGKEEADWAGNVTDHKSWSTNLDFMIPLQDRFTLSGEVFIGDNIDDYFGGVIQGVNIFTRNEISTTGMWAQLNYKYNDKIEYNTGLGIDNPDTDDLNGGMRDQNSFYFINIMYKVFPSLTLGFESSYWETEYKNAPKGTANRYQASAIYSW